LTRRFLGGVEPAGYVILGISGSTPATGEVKTCTITTRINMLIGFQIFYVTLKTMKNQKTCRI
jgi:hypothetical protein